MSIWHLVQSPSSRCQECLQDFFWVILITKFKIQFEYGNFTLLICVELLGCMTQSCSDKNVEWDTLKAFFQDTRMSLALRVHHKDYPTYLLC